MGSGEAVVMRRVGGRVFGPARVVKAVVRRDDAVESLAEGLQPVASPVPVLPGRLPWAEFTGSGPKESR